MRPGELVEDPEKKEVGIWKKGEAKERQILKAPIY